MKIKMRTLAAGPNGVKHPGKVYEVDSAEAKSLVSGGYAEYLDVLPVEIDNSFDAETGETIGYCSVVPATVGEEHIFGDVVYVFDREEEGKLYFSKLKSLLPTLEAFTGLKADEQKAILAGLKTDGDDSNEEKRVALYAAYLETNK